MKRKMIAIVAAVALLLVATVALAEVNWKTPAQIVSGLTGKTVDQVQADRQAGQSYGAQAAAAGELSQFQQECLAQYKQWLDEAVKSGQMTQAEADILYETMNSRMAACVGADNANGLGYGMMGRGMMGTGRFGGGCGRGYGQIQNVN